MKRKNRFLNYILGLKLTKKIICFFSVAFIFNFIICLIIFQLSFSLTSKKEMEAYGESTADQAEVSLNQYFNSVDYTAYSIISSNWLQDLLTKEYNQNTQDYQNKWDSATYFMSTLSQLNNNMGVIIYGNNGTRLSTENIRYNSFYNIEEENWYEEFQEKKRYVQWEQKFPFLIGDAGATYYTFFIFKNLLNF